MTGLQPFNVLFEHSPGQPLPLPGDLAELVGQMNIRLEVGRPWVITNFVSSMDGVVSLVEPGHSGGGDISGFNPHDQAMMGLLRAAADAVIVGAGQLRRPPGTTWLPQTIFPGLSGEYAELRRRLGKPAHPLQVVVTSSGRIDLSLPIFRTPGLSVLILSTRAGYEVISQSSLSRQVALVVADDAGRITPDRILSEIEKLQPLQLTLIEGGPGLVNDFLADERLDELFLTVAPQVAGRALSTARPGFVSGTEFAPHNPRWGEIMAVRQAGSHLFLRYRFPAASR